MKRFIAISCRALIVLCLLASAPLLAGELLMVRSPLTFPEAQPRLEEAIQAQGYALSQAERVDIDLVAIGFSHGNYRVVSYGRPEEIKMLSRRYPELMPFLPLQVVIFGERGSSLLVAINPLYLQQFFSQPELAKVFNRWNYDLERILENVRDVAR